MEELNFDEMRDQITLLKQKLDRQEIVNVLTRFQGIVIVDEAYSDFSRERPL